MKICEDGLGITMRVTTLKITFYVFPSSSGGYFGVFLVPFWDMIFCLSMIILSIRNIQYYFIKLCRDVYKLYDPF